MVFCHTNKNRTTYYVLPASATAMLTLKNNYWPDNLKILEVNLIKLVSEYSNCALTG